MKDYWNKCKRYLLAYLSDDSNSLYQVGRKIVPIVRNCTVVLILLLVYFVLYGSCTVLKEYRITELVFNYSYPDLLIVVVLFLTVVLSISFLIAKWNKCKSFVQDNAVILILLFLYVLFFRFWEGLIGNHIIDGFFSYFKSNFIYDIIFICSITGCLVICYFNRGKSINQRSKLIYVLVILFWIYYRWLCVQCGPINTPFYLHFESLSSIEKVKYVDLLPFYALSKLIPSFFKKTVQVVFNPNKGFVRDVPVISKEEDIMGRKKFAEVAATKLMETDTSNGSFSFGIDAPWGSGKTSFMNLIKEHIQSESDDSIIIDFNPWLYVAENNLVSIFFDELSKCLKRFDLSLAKEIIDYSKLLSSFGTEETKLLSSLVNMNHQKSTLLGKKTQITKAIKQIQKRIYIFVDDLDRLDGDELLEMMKLIRNISDFPYVCFVAAYDKLYLIECLEKMMKTKEIDFTEKIFQIELQLFEGSKSDFRTELLNILDNHIQEEDKQDLYLLIDHSVYLESLSNYREMKRIANSFLVYYECLKGFVNVRDLLLIELLRLKYPLMYSFFVKNRMSFLIKSDNSIKQIKRTISKAGSKINKSVMFIEIKEQRDELKLNDFDIMQIERIFNVLFPDSGGINKGICNVDYFDNYFIPLSSEIEISELEFNKLLNTRDLNLIFKMFTRWSKYKKASLSKRLNEYAPHVYGDIKIFVEVLLYTIHERLADNVSNEIITNSIRYIGKDLIKEFADKEKSYVRDILTKYGYSIELFLYLYSLVYEDGNWDYPLSLEELNDIRIKLFIDCLAHSSSIKETIPCFMLSTEQIRKDGIIIIEYLPEVVSEMKKYIEQHIIDFIPELIVPIGQISKSDQWGCYIINHDIIDALWSSWDDFYNYINSLSDELSPIIVEFKEFLKFYKSRYQIIRYAFNQIKNFEYYFNRDLYDDIVNLKMLTKEDTKSLNELVYYYRALPIQESILNKDHPDIITSYNNIANVYAELSAYDKALKFYEKVLIYRIKAFGEDHPNVAISYNDVGMMYYRQGEYDNAQSMFNRACLIDKTTGYNHPYSSVFLNNAAMASYKRGHPDIALVLLDFATKECIRTNGYDYPFVKHIQQNIEKVKNALE